MTRPTAAQFAVVLAWASLALLGYLLYLVVQPFLVPLGWACVLAVLLQSTQARLTRRLSASTAAALLTVLSALLLIVPAVLVANAFAGEMVDIARRIQVALTDSSPSSVLHEWTLLVQRVPFASRVDLDALAPDLLQRSASFLMAQSGGVVANVAVFFVDLALALFATFFLLRDAGVIMRAVRRLLPMAPATRELFLSHTADLITAGVTSSAVVASLQGFLGGLAFAVLGLSGPVFWGVVMTLASLLPLGAGVIWLPAALYLMATGSMTKGILLIAVGAGIVGTVDNLLRPLLLSEKVHMNGLVIFVSLLGGLNVFGLLGIVLGPIVVVTAMALVTSYVEGTGGSGGSGGL